MSIEPVAARAANVTIYWRLIAAFNANDLETVSALLDPNLIYTLPGRSPVAAHTQGVAAHLDMLRRARELSGGTLKLEPHVVAAEADYVFVYGRVTAERDGKCLDCEHCVVFRFSNGRIVEGRTLPVDLYAFDEFWA
jgi:ketosteroid isomerase-like protein